MDREDSFDSLALDDAADGKHLIDARAATRDHAAGKHLDALLLAFKDALVDIDLVANLELRDFRLLGGLLHQGHQAVFHVYSPLSSRFLGAGPPVRGIGPLIARAASGPPPGDCR